MDFPRASELKATETGFELYFPQQERWGERAGQLMSRYEYVAAISTSAETMNNIAFQSASDALKAKKVTMEQVTEAIESGGHVGFCLGCGAEVDGVEPDARHYKCENCDAALVFGAEELLLMIA
jgi:hypothetical protein